MNGTLHGGTIKATSQLTTGVNVKNEREYTLNDVHERRWRATGSLQISLHAR